MKVTQRIRGTTLWNAAQLFPEGTFTYDTQLHQLRLHDGVTVGGFVVPNQDNIIGFGSTEFSAVETMSVPGVMPTSHSGKLVMITGAGNFQLPSPALSPVGTRITVQAIVPGVNLTVDVAHYMSDKGADVQTTSLNQYELVSIADRSPTHWLVLNRY